MNFAELLRFATSKSTANGDQKLPVPFCLPLYLPPFALLDTVHTAWHASIPSISYSESNAVDNVVFIQCTRQSLLYSCGGRTNIFAWCQWTKTRASECPTGDDRRRRRWAQCRQGTVACTPLVPSPNDAAIVVHTKNTRDVNATLHIK